RPQEGRSDVHPDGRRADRAADPHRTRALRGHALAAVAMNRITLHPPEISAHSATFRWAVEPPSLLYRASRFTLRFPKELEISRIPESLWWTIALMCLHSHWPLLRPCRVSLPVRLGPGEVELWSRLLDAQVATLETYRGTQQFDREIEIV